MPVKGDSGHTGSRRTQAERSATTRAALMAAGRELFTEHGFAGAGREQLVEAAGVTRGAMYHHFANKTELFLAVYEQLEIEVMGKVMAAAKSDDPAVQLRDGATAYLDAAMDPAVQRVMLIDAPSVLPADVRQRVAERNGLGLVREVLAALVDRGAITTQPVEPLARVLLAALHEAALYVAQSSDHEAARREVGMTVAQLIERL